MSTYVRHTHMHQAIANCLKKSGGDMEGPIFYDDDVPMTSDNALVTKKFVTDEISGVTGGNTNTISALNLALTNVNAALTDASSNIKDLQDNQEAIMTEIGGTLTAIEGLDLSKIDTLDASMSAVEASVSTLDAEMGGVTSSVSTLDALTAKLAGNNIFAGDNTFSGDNVFENRISADGILTTNTSVSNILGTVTLDAGNCSVGLTGGTATIIGENVSIQALTQTQVTGNMTLSGNLDLQGLDVLTSIQQLQTDVQSVSFDDVEIVGGTVEDLTKLSITSTDTVPASYKAEFIVDQKQLLVEIAGVKYNITINPIPQVHTAGGTVEEMFINFKDYTIGAISDSANNTIQHPPNQVWSGGAQPYFGNDSTDTEAVTALTYVSAGQSWYTGKVLYGLPSLGSPTTPKLQIEVTAADQTAFNDLLKGATMDYSFYVKSEADWGNESKLKIYQGVYLGNDRTGFNVELTCESNGVKIVTYGKGPVVNGVPTWPAFVLAENLSFQQWHRIDVKIQYSTDLNPDLALYTYRINDGQAQIVSPWANLWRVANGYDPTYGTSVIFGAFQKMEGPINNQTFVYPNESQRTGWYVDNIYYKYEKD